MPQQKKTRTQSENIKNMVMKEKLWFTIGHSIFISPNLAEHRTVRSTVRAMGLFLSTDEHYLWKIANYQSRLFDVGALGFLLHTLAVCSWLVHKHCLPIWRILLWICRLWKLLGANSRSRQKLVCLNSKASFCRRATFVQTENKQNYRLSGLFVLLMRRKFVIIDRGVLKWVRHGWPTGQMAAWFF